MATGQSSIWKVSLCTELVLVCCHAVYTGNGLNVFSESDWLLQPFQQSDPVAGKPGEHETMISHVLAGASIVSSRPAALLVLSGGRTNSLSRRTEAEGYERVLLGPGLDGPLASGARERYALENHATDSYQNLLFSIIRFCGLVGRYPSSVTVVTHAFKERRFLDLHGPAIKWPPDRIRLHGINPPFTRAELEQTQGGEEKRGYAPFVGDVYGSRPPLADKRKARNWSSDAIQDITLDMNLDCDHPVLALLAWEGGLSGNEIFPKPLPWE